VARRRVGWSRVAAPVAFLAAVTIAVLLIRSGLHAGAETTTAPATIPRTAAQTQTVRRPGVRKLLYTVRSGDTFGTIAARYGITVARLEQLNPGVSSNALAVGQKIRVK
jgi:spore germination protein YaaH